MATALGERLHEIRPQMIDIHKPLRTLIDVELPARLADARAKGVATERERCVTIFKRYVSAVGDAWGPGASNPPQPSDCLAELLESAPEPPADEPMTIETMIAKLTAASKAFQNWDTIRADLQKLVKAQARKDAEMCSSTAVTPDADGQDNPAKADHCLECRDAILKAAGLK